jgi:membrane protease YdiL (CAAX protease family)
VEDGAPPPEAPKEEPPPEVAPPVPGPPGPRRFGPLQGILVFLAFLGGQFFIGIAFGLVAALLSATEPERSMNDLLRDAMPALLLLGLSASGMAALLTTRLLVGRPLKGPAGEPFGLKPASLKQVLAGLAVGVLLVLLVRLMPPRSVSPLAEVASTPTGYWSLVVVALLLAPVIEEFTFRGALYAGLRARMPAAPATVVVTLLFTVMHATELVHYWPGFLLIALMSLVTLLLRARTGSLLPAVAAHFAYNLCAMGQAWF